MNRPHVVCHMMGTVDGRIQTERWSLSPAAEKQYEAVHALHKADAWMCGRQTFQGDFMEQPRNATWSRKAKVPTGDFIVQSQVEKKRGEPKPVYAVAVDPSGKIRWDDSNRMRGDRFVVVTTSKAPSGYLADLRTKGISYLIGGKSEIDFASVLARLHRRFGIRKLMLEGGGRINGSLLAEGLVDEISLLVCPYADGAQNVPTVFDAPDAKLGKLGTPLRLLGVHHRPGGVVWLRYRVTR
ncbi:MAG TPA: RibD family protein [Opitutaceae bacterium]|nr:RibD family protein [Opitutaceae bacterium]